MREFTCKLKGPVDDTDRVYTTLRKACLQAGATILRSIDHLFTPQGYTAMFLLAESHATVHTWPEDGYALVNYFSCAEDPKIEIFTEVLERNGFELEDRKVSSR